MHMWFWFDTDLRSFLFSGYDVSTVWGFLATCLGLISLAVVYEAMKVFQIKLHKKTVSALGSGSSGSSENSSLLTQTTSEDGSASTTNWYFKIVFSLTESLRKKKKVSLIFMQ